MHSLSVPLYSLLLTAVAAAPAAVTRDTQIDPNNPNSADPNPFPTSGNSPPPRSSDPWPDGIPVLPAGCHYANLTQDCANTMRVQGGTQKGAYLWLDNDSKCTDDQKDKLKTGWWEAEDILGYSANWPSAGSGVRGHVAGSYWMGPDWQDWQGRIGGNIKRASDFINDPKNSKNYIVLTCADPDSLCKKRKQNMSIGGYAWNYHGWFGYVYGYINMCDPYYSLSDIASKEDEINGYLRNNEQDKVRDMRYYQTYGQFLIHEMFHLDSTSGSEPHIVDEYVTDIPWDSPTTSPLDPKAYGPKLVHKLALKKPNNQGAKGGAAKSSTNADSYAMLLNSIYWWDVNGIFPGVPNKPGPSTASPPDYLYLPSIDLGNNSTPDAATLSALFDKELNSFSATANDPNPDVDDGTSTTSSAPAPPPPSPTPPPPPPPADDKCGDWYKFFFDHFEIYGKDFDPAKFGHDGSGLRDHIQHCGAITNWNFKWLTNDPNGMQWYAEGNQPIGTKSCVGSAVVDAGGKTPDGCTGAG